jgi:hypothetical protein
MISDCVAPPDPAATPTPAPATPAATPIEYAKTTGGVTRRQMNLLLLFVALDSLLFAAFVCLPAATPFVKGMWADYQKRQEDQRRAAVVQAKLNACLAHAAPADRVLYVEEAAGADRMLSTNAGATQLSREIGSRMRNAVFLDEHALRALRACDWQPPARAETAAEAIAWRNALGNTRPSIGDGETTLFLHEMKTPSGQQRLVVVAFTASQYIQDVEPKKEPHRHYELETIRTFAAHVLDPQQPGARDRHTRMIIEDPKPSRTQFLAIFATDDDPKPVVDHRPGQRWRIFAGQADPADPTHLTIGYEIDGKQGVIDGRLNDADRLMLAPRTGRLTSWTGGSEYQWDLTAAAPPAPATGPVIPPLVIPAASR